MAQLPTGVAVNCMLRLPISVCFYTPTGAGAFSALHLFFVLSRPRIIFATNSSCSMLCDVTLNPLLGNRVKLFVYTVLFIRFNFIKVNVFPLSYDGLVRRRCWNVAFPFNVTDVKSFISNSNIFMSRVPVFLCTNLEKRQDTKWDIIYDSNYALLITYVNKNCKIFSFVFIQYITCEDFVITKNNSQQSR